MNYINYQALKNIMLTQKPFRGTTNRFPLTKRSQSYKYFLYEKDDKGEEIFRIINGRRYDTEDVSEEEYHADPKNCNKTQTINEDGTKTTTYYRMHLIPDEVGIVRPDNSFEFTKSNYGQGCMTFLTNFTHRGGFSRDGKRGGMIYLRGPYSQRESMLPIYRGMRVDCDSMKPDPNHTYKLFGMRVDRKKSKDFLKQYEDFFKVSEAMMSNISLTSFIETCIDKLKEIPNADRGSYWKYRYKTDTIIQHAKQIMNDSPLDAAALYCLSLGSTGISNFRYVVAVSSDNDLVTVDDTNAEGYFSQMKREVCNMLYRENPNVLHLLEYEFGKPYPQSNWGYKLEVDGVEVEQY